MYFIFHFYRSGCFNTILQPSSFCPSFYVFSHTLEMERSQVDFFSPIHAKFDGFYKYFVYFLSCLAFCLNTLPERCLICKVKRTERCEKKHLFIGQRFELLTISCENLINWSKIGSSTWLWTIVQHKFTSLLKFGVMRKNTNISRPITSTMKRNRKNVLLIKLYRQIYRCIQFAIYGILRDSSRNGKTSTSSLFRLFSSSWSKLHKSLCRLGFGIVSNLFFHFIFRVYTK